MQIYTLNQSSNHNITISNTALSLEDFIGEHLPSDLDGVDIYIASGGDVRVCWGSEPTDANGFLLKQNAIYHFRGRPLKDMRLVRAGGSDAVCTVSVGAASYNESESTAYLA